MKTLEIVFMTLTSLVFLVALIKFLRRMNFPPFRPFRRIKRNAQKDEALSCMRAIIQKAEFEYVNSIRLKENKLSKDQRVTGLSEAISNLRAICDNH